MTGLPALAPSLQERTETGMLLPYSTASAVTDIEAAGAVIMPAPVPASSVMQPAVPGSAGYDAHGSVQLQAPAPLLGGLFAALDNCWDG